MIIGKPGRYIKRDEAFAHVAGYSCYNEGSVREYQGHNRQFGLGKNFERSGSFGPWLMTPDEFGDPADHTLITRLNGIERQNAKIDGLLFDVPRLIEYLSEGYTLQPGDVIVTGSPGALPLRPGEAPEKPVGNVIVAGQLHMRARRRLRGRSRRSRRAVESGDRGPDAAALGVASSMRSLKPSRTSYP